MKHLIAMMTIFFVAIARAFIEAVAGLLTLSWRIFTAEFFGERGWMFILFVLLPSCLCGVVGTLLLMRGW